MQSSLNPEQIAAERVVLCQYEDPYSKGPLIAVAVTSRAELAEWAFRAKAVDSIGASEAFWSRVGPKTFFIESSWPSDGGLNQGFAAATGLPVELFGDLERRYEAECEPVLVQLQDVDAEQLLGRLQSECARRSITTVSISEADGIKLRREGDIIPLSESFDDDGRVTVRAFALPIATDGQELAEAYAVGSEHAAGLRP